MNLNNICKYCNARIFFERTPEKIAKRHYHAPILVRNAWKEKIGTFPLGPFRKEHCEICHKHMAVFDKARGELKGTNVVLFVCTFSDIPASDECSKYGNCYNCPVPKEQRKNGIRKHY